MPITPTYPGVYIEEVPSGVRTISGVATSITAFVGHTARGLENRPTRLFSFADFERAFGGLAANSELSYAVQQFFDNGGSDAYVVRVTHAAAKAAEIVLTDGAKDALKLTALSKGAWGNAVVADVDHDGLQDDTTFNLTVTDLASGQSESFPGVTLDAAKPNSVARVVNDPDSGSRLVSAVVPDPTAKRPTLTGTTGVDIAALNLDPAKAFALKVKINAESPDVDTELPQVEVLAANEPRPKTVEGYCLLLEGKVNPVLDQAFRGATLSCRPAPNGKGIRARVLFPADRYPKRTDALVTFAAPGAGPENAAAALGLTGAGVKENVTLYRLGQGRAKASQKAAVPGDDKGLPGTAELIGSEAAFSGIYALRKVDLFNLLCIPDATRASAGNPTQLDAGLDSNQIFQKAMSLCLEKRAFLLIDPPPGATTLASAVEWKSTGLKVHERNGAAYWPRLGLADPLNRYQLRTFAPSGVVAGVYSRIDASRGIWKAPAGVEATLRGVQSLVYRLSDPENGAINILGLNGFRSFPVYGNVAWGARTLVGANDEGSEWKYVPVRRLALYLEESLYRGTQWVVFEPNDEALWAQIRLNVGSFLNDLFRQGAFQGKTPREAYLVKCDRDTTTQSDINRGIVNVLVGFAPLKPAEFVFLRIQQLAGQIQT